MEGVEDFLKKREQTNNPPVAAPVKVDRIEDVKSLTEVEREDLEDRFFMAMVANWGNVSKSCVECGITRSGYRQLMKKKKFKKRLEEAEFKEMYKDFIEYRLAQLIRKGDKGSIIFASKTLLKDRGYVERTEVTGKDGKELQQIKVKIVNTERTRSDTKIDKEISRQAKNN